MMPMTADPRQAMRDSSRATIDAGVGGLAPPASVNYRPAEDPSRVCASCMNFQGPDRCSIVAGKIDPQATCDAWQGEPEGPQEDAAEGGVEER